MDDILEVEVRCKHIGYKGGTTLHLLVLVSGPKTLQAGASVGGVRGEVGAWWIP